ncbi:hypothetical protein N8865_02565 [Francisellaceae bacterium]|nr:hypothetical protein [Francisellaceae bacterium]
MLVGFLYFNIKRGKLFFMKNDNVEEVNTKPYIAPYIMCLTEIDVSGKAFNNIEQSTFYPAVGPS